MSVVSNCLCTSGHEDDYVYGLADKGQGGLPRNKQKSVALMNDLERKFQNW